MPREDPHERHTAAGLGLLAGLAVAIAVLSFSVTLAPVLGACLLLAGAAAGVAAGLLVSAHGIRRTDSWDGFERDFWDYVHTQRRRRPAP